MNRSHYRGTITDDYVRIILTDEHEEPDARRKLEMIYKNLMCIEYDNKRTQAASSFTTAVSADKKTPTQHFGDFFKMQNGQPMNDEQTTYVADLFNQIFEETNT